MNNDLFLFEMIGAYDTGTDKTEITPFLSIGNHRSSYKPFDIVVNADYPNNYIQNKKIGRLEHVHCTIFLIGLCDHDSEEINTYIDNLIPRLSLVYQENSRILFHCYAGKSRSVVLALAFLVEIVGMTFEDAYELVKEKRPCIKPREHFINIVRERYRK
jgi:hypothetical protein